MSQETLSRRLKDETGAVIDQSGIARIEAGRRAVRLNEVAALAQVLGLNSSEFLGGSDIEEDTIDRAMAELARVDEQAKSVRAMAEQYETALAKARDDLALLLAQQAHLHNQIKRVTQYREALGDLRRGIHGDG